MDKILPHGTRVPKKKTNEDDDEDEELEMGRKSKTRELEMGRRSRSIRSKNLFGERRSNEEESRAGEHRFDEEESRAEGKKNRGRRGSTGDGKSKRWNSSLKTRVPRGFFFHISFHSLQLEF